MGCDIHSIGQFKANGSWRTKIIGVGDDQRDYDSFGILANVRNGYGFAGCETGEGWPYLSEPRGLPEDFNTDGFDVDLWLGDHSHSWLLLSEMVRFNMKVLSPAVYQRIGIVDRQTYQDILDRKLKAPETWCAGIGGPNVVIVDEAGYPGDTPCTHVRMRWKEPALECAHYFQQVIKELSFFAETMGLSHDKVRFVFGFDS